jgi:hypothetical protein
MPPMQLRSAADHALSLHVISHAVVHYIHLGSPEPQDPFDFSFRLQDLSSLVTVNRTLSESALDYMWARTTMWRLARMMPSKSWTLRLINLANGHELVASEEECQREIELHPTSKFSRVLVSVL